MREILFKAKRKDNDEWIYGYPMRHPQAVQVGPYEPYWNMFVPPANPEDTGGVFDIDPDTLCQYTGKSDEDGKKIFEGDIVGFIDLYSTESGYSESSCLGEVIWSKEECCFHVTNRLSAESFEVLDECKVVGNIFDNPELVL